MRAEQLYNFFFFIIFIQILELNNNCSTLNIKHHQKLCRFECYYTGEKEEEEEKDKNKTFHTATTSLHSNGTARK